MVKCLNFGVRQPPNCVVWASYFITLRSYVLLCKMGMVVSTP